MYAISSAIEPGFRSCLATMVIGTSVIRPMPTKASTGS
jgi:hypothetical protein